MKGTFPSVWESHLGTMVEEGKGAGLANQNGMGNIAVCDDHPQGERACDSCYSGCWNPFAVVEEIMSAMETDFDRMGKNEKKLQENVNAKASAVAAVP